ncbi:TRAP transporter substrate-binding protein [uncultured Dysosmobacter sp.]|uniref:TRAP transporter substrate-binding protein n=1 Tax=uncultured Dysosmobacter sp. TaxID=2591384 RepID=UPI00342B7AD4
MVADPVPPQIPPPASDNTEASEVITIKIGHVLNEESPFHAASLKFAELVSEKSGGSLQVEVYPSALLGNDRELAEGLQMGTVDAAVCDSSTVTGFCPELQLFSLPYLFKNSEHVYEVLDGEIGQELIDMFYEQSGIIGLAWGENGWRQETNSIHPVTCAADMQGLKIRTMEISCHLDYWKSLGADPTPMAWTEVYTALQQGTVDGQENPVQTIYTQKVYEVQKYMSMTNHVYAPMLMMMSESLWNKLTEEQQNICKEAAKEACAYERQFVSDLEARAIKELPDLGVELLTNDQIDTESFRVAAAPIIEKYGTEMGVMDLVSQIQAIGEKY